MTKTIERPGERTGQDRLLDLIKTAKALQNASLAMSSAEVALIFSLFARDLTAANTEIAAQMAELIAAKPTYCCVCDKEHGPTYQYSGLCDTCYEDRIA